MTKGLSMMRARMLFTLSALAGLAACGEDGTSTGSLQVQLEAEETITEGIPAGEGDDAIVDGWSVTFDKYVVAIGDVEVEGGGDGHFHAHDAVVVDLAQVPEGGFPLATFEDMPTGLWPEVFYSTPAVTAEATRDASVSQADFDRMVAGGCTYLIVGTITSPSGERCIGGDDTMCTSATEIDFDLCVPAPTVFGPCESDTGIEGVVVAEGTTTAVNFTIHGDHLFFNGFPMGAEAVIERRAQWLANADIDADGTVTQSDLESIGASDLGQLLAGYELGGAPITLNDAWDYVVAQLKTQGHFQGEGECPWDGMGHEHE
ncbi:hypothetical protein [Sandaracinus amylolyticus]|uniref:Putative lipoprotein n=1 Tax=Sandaracinus amylolyticus TaxID=927083 RepID=A0A0F6YMY0_9BACT|nr:hypothetical protein [Sandaracinus amylolyticus]AKF11278.1 putative lipoprotein [Sandaracinus amylolyticus]